jgi:uncharacterized protein (DUF433 family)
VIKSTKITVDSYQIGGVSCIRHLRIPVATVVSMVAEGMTESEILTAYPEFGIGRYSRIITICTT